MFTDNNKCTIHMIIMFCLDCKSAMVKCPKKQWDSAYPRWNIKDKTFLLRIYSNFLYLE